MSTFATTDKCTDIILDFISGGIWGDKLGNPVGESDGNYNAYFGHVHSTVDLRSMNLGQIYTFQAAMLRQDLRSTAIGRYQFLRGTLRSLQAKRRLSNSEPFTPALQDRLAVDLLIGRGYPSWWRGHMTDSEFAHGLSCEWASLPDPRNYGKSHYDGDSAGNHASTQVSKVLAMLAAARAAKP